MSKKIDWSCAGCAADLREHLIQRCDTIVDYLVLAEDSGKKRPEFSFGESDVCYDCDDNCRYLCGLCFVETGKKIAKYVSENMA